jgi:hypothetical protein
MNQGVYTGKVVRKALGLIMLPDNGQAINLLQFAVHAVDLAT